MCVQCKIHDANVQSHLTTSCLHVTRLMRENTTYSLATMAANMPSKFLANNFIDSDTLTLRHLQNKYKTSWHCNRHGNITHTNKVIYEHYKPHSTAIDVETPDTCLCKIRIISESSETPCYRLDNYQDVPQLKWKHQTNLYVKYI